MVTLAELSDYQGIVYTSSVVALELIDDFLLKEADILGLNLVG